MKRRVLIACLGCVFALPRLAFAISGTQTTEQTLQNGFSYQFGYSIEIVIPQSEQGSKLCLTFEKLSDLISITTEPALAQMAPNPARPNELCFVANNISGTVTVKAKSTAGSGHIENSGIGLAIFNGRNDANPAKVSTVNPPRAVVTVPSLAFLMLPQPGDTAVAFGPGSFNAGEIITVFQNADQPPDTIITPFLGTSPAELDGSAFITLVRPLAPFDPIYNDKDLSIAIGSLVVGQVSVPEADSSMLMLAITRAVAMRRRR